MVYIACWVGVMPQKYDFTGILVYLLEQSLALEVCLIFAEVHVVGIAQCTVHDRQRVEQ